jgi:hypothetical protein
MMSRQGHSGRVGPIIPVTVERRDLSLRDDNTGYLLTHGGFMLLGRRTADLPGQRPILVAGVAVSVFESRITNARLINHDREVAVPRGARCAIPMDRA